jgi:CheY-like chemotaxis protein
MSDLNGFEKAAVSLARNPLGIIALFIVMVYGFACLLLGLSSNGLDVVDRRIFVVFLVSFPVLVLALFGWLVTQHAAKLYGPLDYKREETFAAAVGITASVSTHLAAAEASSSAVTDSQPTLAVNAEAVAQVVLDSLPAATALTGRRKRILWVDDRPQNNVQLRRAFEEIGIFVQTATSTDRALEYLRADRYDVIITDIERSGGPDEGLVLLAKVREGGNRVPVFVYTGKVTDDDRIRYRNLGANESTASPSALFKLVADAMAKDSHEW